MTLYIFYWIYKLKDRIDKIILYWLFMSVWKKF